MLGPGGEHDRHLVGGGVGRRGERSGGDGRLWARDHQISLVQVGDWTSPSVTDPASPLHQALRAGAVTALDGCTRAWRHGKASLAWLSDPALGLGLSADDQRFVDDTVPWTRLARPGATTDPEGALVELSSFVAAHREQLVIKPSRGALGAHVLVGRTTTPADWSASVATVFGGSDPTAWVVQAFVPPAQGSWPVWSSEGLRFQPFREDLDVFVFSGGEVDGATCRLHTGWVSNLSVNAANTVTPRNRCSAALISRESPPRPVAYRASRSARSSSATAA